MKKPRFDLGLQALTVAQTLCAVPLLGRKWRRFSRRRDSYEWDKSRWNGDWLQAPDAAWRLKTGPHLAFYADGFAETRMAIRLIRALEKERPATRFSLVIRNLRDVRNGGALPPDLPFCALPFEYFFAVKNWFRGAQPDGVVMVEKLFYPVFVRGCASLGARVVGVNSYARASDCAENPRFKSWITRGFSRLGLRSSEQQNLLAPLLGAVPFEITGSLKFPPPREKSSGEKAPELSADLAAFLGLALEKPMIAAGSVEAGEIEVLCAAFALLRQTCDAVLLWAPRKIDGADALQIALQERGFSVARRSENRANRAVEMAAQKAPDVLILDTMGELAASYTRCEGAFVGGTFAGGGHNVLEPLGAGIPTVFGPKRGFFAAEQKLCEENGVGSAANDAAELAAAWQKMLEDENYRREVRARIAVFIETGQHSWDATERFLLACFE